MGFAVKEQIDSEENLQKEFENLKNKAKEDKLEVFLEGTYQIQARDTPGPKFPFIIGQSKDELRMMDECIIKIFSSFYRSKNKIIYFNEYTKNYRFYISFNNTIHG